VNGPYIIIWGIILAMLALIGIKVNKKYKKIAQSPSPSKIISQDSSQEKDPDK
jgi:hypothetical protein